jgi:predicted DCC family thiol-disulfide oxidoreductase YuxK
MGEALRNKGLDVIYDAQCRFCRRSLSLLQWLAGDRLFHLHDANDRELLQSKFPMLACADTNDAMYVVTPRGEVFRGFFAFRRIMWESPRLYPFLPLFYAPGAALLGPRIYAWVAKNRRNFGCSLDGSKVCAIARRPDATANTGGTRPRNLDGVLANRQGGST